MQLARRGLIRLTMLAVAAACASSSAQQGAVRPLSALVAPALLGETGTASNAYAAEPAVVEHLDTVYRYHADGTGTRLDTVVLRVQHEAGVRRFLALSTPYLAGTQGAEYLYVRVRKPNGGVVTTPVADAQDQVPAMTQVAPFYSDLHLLAIAVRGLAPGDRLEYAVRTTTRAAAAPQQFWAAERFGAGLVTLERGLELRYPAEKAVLVSSPGRTPTITTEAGDKVYRWSGQELTPTVRPASALAQVPAESAGEPIQAPEAPAVAWSTFGSWAEVGAWYRGVEGEAAAPTPAIKAKADAVAYGAATPEAKARALYQFVSQQVRSINVPLGQGPYQANTAEQVLANLYGDSKDKATLLAALLRSEGLTPSLVLIGGGQALSPDLPSPGLFSEVLVQLPGEHGPVWLDPMPEVAPPGVLPEPLRSRLALVIPPTAAATLERTPEDLPYPAHSSFQSIGELSGEGALTAHVELQLGGDDALEYGQILRSVGPAQWDRIAQFYAQQASLPGQIGGTNLVPPATPGASLDMSFDLQQAPYGDWANFRVTPLEPGLRLPFTNRQTAPEGDIELGGKHTEVAKTELTLPQGYGADLPPAVHLHASFADLDKLYRVEQAGGRQKLVTERTLVIRQGKLPPTAWAEYRTFVQAAAQSEPWIQLTSTGGGAKAQGPPSAGVSVPAAALLVEQAGQALGAANGAEARTKLDQAATINPHQPLLWSTYGFLAQSNDKPEEAVADYQHELRDHPEEGQVSRQLAGLLLRLDRRPEALEVLRAAAVLAPRDQSTVILLAAVLDPPDAAAAEKVLRSGLAASPESLELKLSLGRDLLEEGKRDEGAALLAAVANTSVEPGELNDAAFALADAGLNLRLAEAASRRSIQLLNLARIVAEPSERVRAELRQSLRLISAWDTYGWVLFKEGSYSEAEPWLMAAWADSYGAADGRHLAALLSKQGRTAEAAQVLALAQRGERGESARDVHNALSGSVAEPGNTGADTSLAELRTFSFGRPKTAGNGTALYLLDYSVNADPAAQFVQGDSSMAAMADAVAAVKTNVRLPAGTQAHLYRLGRVTCGKTSACSLEVLPPRTAAVR